MSRAWYRRLADVPNVGYPGSPGINRTRLPGHNAEPTIETLNWEGKKEEYLSWPIRGGTSSASPAHSWQSESRKGETLGQTTIRHLYEVLELPGTLSDYHFAIQECHSRLWDWPIRRQEPWVYGEIFQLCLLNIRLIEAYPHIVRANHTDDQPYYAVTAFFKLIRLYMNEGYLYEALAIAERAIRFEQHHEDLEDLRKRIAVIEAENG